MELRRGRVVIAIALILSSVFGISQKAIAEVVSAVSIVAPTMGTSVNPYLPFAITLDLIGGNAITANTCIDGELANFQFGAELIDSHNFGQNLGYFSTGQNLSGWVQRIIPGGIECSLLVNSQWGVGWQNTVDQTDNDWFGVTQASYTGNASDFGPPKKLDIAWKFDGKIVHNVYPVTDKGTPAIQIVGLTRGQVVNYSTQFQLVETLDSGISPRSLTAESDFSKYDVVCDDFSNAKISESSGLDTYDVDCVLNLKNLENGSYPPTVTITPYSDLGDVQIRPEVTPVTVDVGKTGFVVFQTFEEGNSFDKGAQGSHLGGSIASMDSSKPWSTPALFTLEGVVCAVAASESDMCDSSIENIAGAEINVCILGKCSVVLSASDGTFTFSQKVNTATVSWSATTTYQNQPVADAWGDYPDPPWGGHAKATGYKLSDTVSLPSKPLTAAQIKASNAAMYQFGKNYLNGLPSSFLIQLDFLSYFLPGNKSLTPSYAQNFCRSLLTRVEGLSAKVPTLSRASFVNGCAAAAITIRLR